MTTNRSQLSPQEHEAELQRLRLAHEAKMQSKRFKHEVKLEKMRHKAHYAESRHERHD